MAEAFGGKVVKSDKGLGRGPACLRRRRGPALDGRGGEGGRARLAPGPGDRHPAEPPGRWPAAPSPPAGVLVYDDRPAISMQFHPEFDPAYARALIESRRGKPLHRRGGRRGDRQPGRANDRARVADWIQAFLAQTV